MDMKETLRYIYIAFREQVAWFIFVFAKDVTNSMKEPDCVNI